MFVFYLRGQQAHRLHIPGGHPLLVEPGGRAGETVSGMECPVAIVFEQNLTTVVGNHCLVG